MEPPLFDASCTSILPVSFVFSRLGGNDSSVFHCEPNWFQCIDGSHPNHEPRKPSSYEHLDPSGAIASNDQDEPMPRPTATALRQYSMPWIASNHSNQFKGRVASAPYRQDHIQARNPEPSAGREMQEFLPLVFPSARPEVASGYTPQSTTKLLPPIVLATQSPSPSLPTLKPPTIYPLIERDSYRPPVLPNDSFFSPNADESDPNQDHTIAANPDSVHSQRCLISAETSLRQPSLHKALGSRELRQQAGWPLIGPEHSVQAANDFLSYCPVSSSENHSTIPGQPVTPPRKPRLWFEGPSSDERVQEAVKESQI
ncbi:MAG: hypothetical protein Q9166_002006 [cf. Caloplaca sp. 2 TL-2023]